MSADPRAALAVLVTAFERHLEASSGRRGENDPTVLAAYDDLVDAFEAYDGALYDATGEMTPFDLYEPDEDDEGDEDDDDSDDADADDDDDYFDEGDDDDELMAQLDDAGQDDE